MMIAQAPPESCLEKLENWHHRIAEKRALMKLDHPRCLLPVHFGYPHIDMGDCAQSIMLALPGTSFVIAHHWPVWYFRLPERILSQCNPANSWFAVSATSLRKP
jgi:hypothetical protein